MGELTNDVIVQKGIQIDSGHDKLFNYFNYIFLDISPSWAFSIFNHFFDRVIVMLLRPIVS